MASLIWVGIASFVISLVLTRLLRDALRRLGILDHPEGNRKIHRSPIPRGGGLAIALAYVASYLVVSRFFGGAFDQQLVLVWKILTATIVILAVGLMDDLFGLKPWQKLTGQFVGAGIACWKGIVIGGGAGSFEDAWWRIGLTIVWLLVCSNAFNLVDGMDGLAAGLGLVSTVAVFFGAGLQHNTQLAIATIPLAGALLGFLRYNFNPATIFLGDSGSLSLGFVLGCFSIVWIGHSSTLHGIAAPLIALSIPLLDVTLAIGRRLLRGQHIFAADRRHIHHRLLDQGMTPKKAVLVLYAAGIGVSLVALLHQSTLGNGSMSGLMLLLFCGFVLAAIRYLGYSEFALAGKMLARGDLGRVLAAQLDLRALEDAISRAATPAACAELVVASIESLGCVVTKVRFAGHVTGSRPGATPPHGWTFRVPLDNGDFIELAREFGDSSSSAHVGPLVDVLRGSLVAKGRTFTRIFNVGPQIVPARLVVGEELAVGQADSR
jgi:UDP-GlcNAc:undecaprenyl-phosphate GlcNAc-1-phosphate transferase